MEKYDRLAHIGHGAFADVYLVRHIELGYVRALKVLNTYIENKDQKAYRSFIKECKTLLQIGNYPHPNIVNLHNPDLIDNHAVVEMDYIKGQTLDSYIRQQGFLPYEEAKRFIHDIVGALAYTHHDIYRVLMDPNTDDLQSDPNDGSRFLITPDKEAELIRKYGIAHNDLHSNNVMRRDDDGRYMLLDFGIAVQDGQCVRSSGRDNGCPEFMAPEKFELLDITPRSDVYSLGVMIFQAMTGEPPFIIRRGPDGSITLTAMNELLNLHLNAERPSMLERRRRQFEAAFPGEVYERDYPEWLDAVVAKCLAPEPANRYADARALLNDIQAHEQQDRAESMSLPADVLAEFSEAGDALVAENDQLHAELKEKADQWYAEKERLRAEIDRLRAEIDRLRAENDALRKANDQDHTATPADAAAMHELKRQLAEAEKAIKHRDDTIRHLTAQLAELKSKAAQGEAAPNKSGRVWSIVAIVLAVIGLLCWLVGGSLQAISILLLLIAVFCMRVAYAMNKPKS